LGLFFERKIRGIPGILEVLKVGGNPEWLSDSGSPQQQQQQHIIRFFPMHQIL